MPRPFLSYAILSLAVAGGILLAVQKPGVRPSLISNSSPPVPHADSQLAKPMAVSSYGLPVQLQIARLKVDAKVLYMGQTKTGNMQVPANVVDVGWYKYGALPGNSGTAVIAGHLDGLKAEPGVFSNLSKLQPGDIVTIRDNAGAAADFRVRTSKSYGQDEQPVAVFTSANGAHLNLITCTGAWDKSAHQFAKRLVVFTDRI